MNLRRLIGDKGLLFTLKHNVAAEVYGIRLVTFGTRPQFVRIMSNALELICNHDDRRFHRVQTHIRWIFDGGHWGGAGCATYYERIKACKIDFQMYSELGDELTHAAGYAGLIIHEATHGAVEARHIKAAPEHDERVERLCYTEQSRFVRRLRKLYPDIPAFVDSGYDPNFYQTPRRAHRIKLFGAEVRRAVSKIAEQFDGPNSR